MKGKSGSLENDQLKKTNQKKKNNDDDYLYFFDSSLYDSDAMPPNQDVDIAFAEETNGFV
jgi:hypothetical protein